MKKVGLILASFGLASGAIYGGMRLLRRRKDKREIEDRKSAAEDEDNEEEGTSISTSYVYVADFLTL
jgi:Na+/glutamate symporter